MATILRRSVRVLVRSAVLGHSTRARWLHSATVRQRESEAAQVIVSDNKKKLALQCAGEQERTFHGIWLRHNCRCPLCYSHDASMSLVNYTQLIGVELASANVQGQLVQNMMLISSCSSSAHHVHAFLFYRRSGCHELEAARRLYSHGLYFSELAQGQRLLLA